MGMTKRVMVHDANLTGGHTIQTYIELTGIDLWIRLENISIVLSLIKDIKMTIPNNNLVGVCVLLLLCICFRFI